MAMPQKLRCKVENIIAHGERVYTLDIVPDHASVPRFKPGQFLHLALDPYDPSGFWPESRVFSIASSPRQRDRIQITYSVKGRYTERMEQEIVSGSNVWVKLPYGEFTIDVTNPAVIFAGGTGITAFTAFLDDLIDNPPSPVMLFYRARESTLLVYRALVEQCRQNVDPFNAIYFLEKNEKPAENELPGQLSIQAAWNHISNPLNSQFYLSGPPAMLKTLSTQLGEKGIMSNRIHIDAWE
jgi:ferredoxin-NADP reductase